MKSKSKNIEERDGKLYFDDGKPVLDFWSGEHLSTEVLYSKYIGSAVDMVVKNIDRNCRNRLYAAEFMGETRTVRQDLPPLYRNIISKLWFAEGDITVGNLAKILNISNSNLTPELNRMEEDGYIYREISKTNRRCVNVYLTDKSIAVVADYQYKINPVWEKMFVKEFNREELIDLYRALCKVNYYMNRFDPQNKIYRMKSEEFFENGDEEHFELTFNEYTDDISTFYKKRIEEWRAEHDIPFAQSIDLNIKKSKK